MQNDYGFARNEKGETILDVYMRGGLEELAPVTFGTEITLGVAPATGNGTISVSVDMLILYPLIAGSVASSARNLLVNSIKFTRSTKDVLGDGRVVWASGLSPLAAGDWTMPKWLTLIPLNETIAIQVTNGNVAGQTVLFSFYGYKWRNA